MGGHHETRKTFTEVQEDLRRNLLANARSLLSSYGVWMSEYSAIEDVLRRIASEQFKRSYGYEYSSNGYQIRPPKSTGDNRPIDKMCNITTPIWNQVTDYLKAGVFSNMNLPRWMEQQAIAELCGKANDLVRWDTYRQWRHSEYSQTFDAKVEDTDSFICNSVLVYVNGSLTEDGITASSCIIYYSGVYYKTESPTTELRRDLQRRAYDESSRLYWNLCEPKYDGQLADNLSAYSNVVFRENFGFDFDGTPPDSCRADGVNAALMTYNKELCYLPNLDTDAEVSHYIDQHIFSGLNIPLASVKRAALENTVKEFRNAMQSGSPKVWTVRRLDQIYKPASPSAHPVREKGILMSWHRAEYARSGQMVSVTYIYVMTMFYETLPPEEQAIKALFRLLCNNLCARLHQSGHIEGVADDIALHNMLSEYAKGQFKQGFGFDYAGEHSEPPGRHGNRVKGFAELFQTQRHPPPDGSVEEWLDAEIFRRGSRTFPDYANDTIWNDIRNTTIECITQSCTREDWWFHTRKQRVYENPSGDVNMKHYGIYVYACGEIEYEGVRVHRMFVYYLGVYCGVSK